MALNPISLRFPFELKDQPPEVVQAHRYAFSGLVDLNQAVASLKKQLDGKSTITTTVSTSSRGGGGVAPTPFPFPGLGGLNDQTGSVAYTIQSTDNGIFLIFSDASPVAVTLNSAMTTPFFFFASNFGVGTTTFTPSTGLINGGASWGLPEGGLFFVAFDGANWKTSDVLVLAQTFTAITHEFLTAYDAATGLFTAAQPAFADISGTLATSQLPATVPVVSFGSGAPAGSSTEGYIYFDNSGSPYHGYVYHSSSWNQFS